jgi:hypothetical protein
MPVWHPDHTAVQGSGQFLEVPNGLKKHSFYLCFARIMASVSADSNRRLGCQFC